MHSGPATPVPCLGINASRTHNPAMEIKSDNPDHGFQFPGQFELSAMGPANRGLEHELPRLLLAAGIGQPESGTGAVVVGGVTKTVMAIFLWLVDKGLEWVLYDLVLGWRQ